MATDGQMCFIRFLYADIQWGPGAQIGFDAGDGMRSFTIPGALSDATLEMESMSNIKISGTFLYRVDASVCKDTLMCTLKHDNI